MKARMFLLIIFTVFLKNFSNAQKNLAEDKALVNSFLMCVSHGGYPLPLLLSPKADTASIHKKLRVLGLRWEKEKYRRDSILLNATMRIPVEGTKTEMVLVYFMYRNIEWDELLLLINKDDGLLLDIANYGDVFYFKKYYRLRYHYNKTTLYNYFYPRHSNQKELEATTKNIVRLALADKKDSLYQHIQLIDTSFRAYKTLGAEWMAQTEKAQKEKMIGPLINSIKEAVSSPESLTVYGSFQSDTKKGTCHQEFRCRITGKNIFFYFQKQDSKYLLYKVFLPKY